MVTVDKFAGPITAFAITEWISNCESAFETWEDDNSGKSLTDKQKIHAVGGSIVKNAATDDLHTWWLTNHNNLETRTWVFFQDSLKERALGRDWVLRSLREMFSTTQGSQSIDQYFAALNRVRFVLSRAGPEFQIPDFDFKCHLLFRAAPGLLDQLLKDDFHTYSLTSDSDEGIKAWLKKYPAAAAPINHPTPTPSSPLITPESYIVTRPWGWYSGDPFSDLTSRQMNIQSIKMPHLRELSIWTNKSGATQKLIQGFYLKFNTLTDTFRSPPKIADGWEEHVLTLADDEYLTQAQARASNKHQAITAIEFTTSKGRTLGAGELLDEHYNYKAPPGWRIVGFHGTAHTGSAELNPLSQLGMIYAPVK
ncbi:hypothetical protein BJY04DRAFT_174169 [Aspergillus karnatakaensis]|uniref:uncharacterized protein n=1 Tax=Aspergillus karnatakaensis TaxID=1810916 RepID=UPI003CCE5195